MQLIRIINASGDKLPVCEAPSSLLSSRRGLEMFLRTHASRIYGFEGRDFRVCSQPQCLVPLYVNQLVAGADGQRENGESLVIE